MTRKRKMKHESQLKNIDLWRMHLKGSKIQENTIIKKISTIFSRFGQLKKYSDL